MASSDWDKELAKIDKQLESISDDALVGKPEKAAPAQQAKVQAKRSETSTFGVFARLVLAIALGFAMLFWPYPARCGVGLFAYLFAAVMVIVAGVWSSIWTWRHRTAQGHVLALLLIVWGVVLGATEVLPRVGYAKPNPGQATTWMCQ